MDNSPLILLHAPTIKIIVSFLTPTDRLKLKQTCRYLNDVVKFSLSNFFNKNGILTEQKGVFWFRDRSYRVGLRCLDEDPGKLVGPHSVFGEIRPQDPLTWYTPFWLWADPNVDTLTTLKNALNHVNENFINLSEGSIKLIRKEIALNQERIDFYKKPRRF